jgi:hypothetical protein
MHKFSHINLKCSLSNVLNGSCEKKNQQTKKKHNDFTGTGTCPEAKRSETSGFVFGRFGFSLKTRVVDQDPD